MKTYSLEEITNKHIGKKGTPERNQFEFELKLEILGEMIKKARKERKMTQEQLGELIGVKKAQISKIENHTKDVRLSTILRVFDALKADVKMRVDFDATKQLEIV
ncbi:MAG: helix-turn-helix domain-containing protein [Bacteroidales bacterium]|nr:helix-turn-helix domain-containing protein [Bacteroidales bacterium]MCF8337981.1 helix-turn-helix domain-containing protein [Bacteroidales bacterium]